MRKTTINLIVGILIGMIISGVSDSVSTDSEVMQTNIPVATTITTPASLEVANPFDQQIAPGLQIIEVPPPLDLNGRHPYQCYFNGQPVKLPNDVVKNLLAENDHLIEKDDSVNVHNFIGNLKMIPFPSEPTVSQPVGEAVSNIR
jgi:hypothetical protein